MVHHFQTYLEDEEIQKVLQVYQRSIAELIHAQMQPHFWEEALGYEAEGVTSPPETFSPTRSGG